MSPSQSKYGSYLASSYLLYDFQFKYDPGLSQSKVMFGLKKVCPDVAKISEVETKEPSLSIAPI